MWLGVVVTDNPALPEGASVGGVRVDDLITCPTPLPSPHLANVMPYLPATTTATGEVGMIILCCSEGQALWLYVRMGSQVWKGMTSHQVQTSHEAAW